jgi:hypothetical protein
MENKYTCKPYIRWRSYDYCQEGSKEIIGI